jgi:hypothetical protein
MMMMMMIGATIVIGEITFMATVGDGPGNRSTSISAQTIISPMENFPTAIMHFTLFDPGAHGTSLRPPSNAHG